MSSALAPPLFIFLHIEKTAGTTLHKALQSTLKGYQIVKQHVGPLGSDPDLYYSSAQLTSWLQKAPYLNALGGHGLRIFANYESIGRPIHYATFLREPTARYLSHYYFQKELHHLPWTLESYLEETRFHNVMCQRICGKASAKEAIQLLHEKNVFVGITEHFQKSLPKLIAHLQRNGIHALNPWIPNAKNVREKRGRTSSDEQENALSPEIRSANQEDEKLYQHFLQGMSSSGFPSKPATLCHRARRQINRIQRLHFRRLDS